MSNDAAARLREVLVNLARLVAYAASGVFAAIGVVFLLPDDMQGGLLGLCLGVAVSAGVCLAGAVEYVLFDSGMWKF